MNLKLESRHNYIDNVTYFYLVNSENLYVCMKNFFMYVYIILLKNMHLLHLCKARIEIDFYSQYLISLGHYIFRIIIFKKG